MKTRFALLAGGSGTRMHRSLPKQMLSLAGRPVFVHSLRAYLNWTEEGRAVIVSRADLLTKMQSRMEEFLEGQTERVDLVEGGSTRHASNLAGIAWALESSALDEQDVILVHDAARPLLEVDEIARLVGVFQDDPDCMVASLVSRITDTVVSGSLPGQAEGRLERERLFAVKTPQAIRVGAARQLLELEDRPEFTDLLSWAQAGGISGSLVEASSANVKLTQPEDLPLLEFLAMCRGMGNAQ